MTDKPRIRVPSRAPTADGFVNFQARLGYGAGNQFSGSTYQNNFISRDRIRLEAMYRTSWIIGQAVDVVAEDMVRAGVEIKSKDDASDIEKVQATLANLGVWTAIEETVKWSRLYGGAIGIMLIDGQNPGTPLRPQTIRKDQFKGLLVLDRWMVQPSVVNFVEEYGPELGQPASYDVIPNPWVPLSGMRVHHTRVIRLEGVRLPYQQRLAENGWGQSVAERIYDQLVAYDSTSQGAAQLVYKAHLRTLSIEGLRELIAAGGQMFEAVIKQVDVIRSMQSNEGLTLLDAKDKFETHAYSFSGLSDVLLQFGQQLSGALQIPLVRLFGQSPAGLNSTGESDLRTYYDGIAQRQNSTLRLPFGRLLDVVYRSTLGRDPPDGFGFEFEPLWQLSDKEKAEVAESVTRTVTAGHEAGFISERTALNELRQSADVTGVWSNITDDEIDAADDLPPDPGEMDADAEASDLRPGNEALASGGVGEKPEGGNKVREPTA